MHDAILPGVLEATRLLREDRIADATALLRSSLGTPATTEVPRTTPRTLDASTLGRAGLPRWAGLGATGAPARAPMEPLADGARVLARTHSGAEGTRAYKLYVPGGRRAQPKSLVVMLHGCTQDPDDFAAGTRMNALAEAHGFLVAYPAQTMGANARNCWNWFNPGDQARGRGEPAILAGITSEVADEFGLSPGRTFVAGLSAGGAMAAILGHAYPDLYAAVGVHSGLAPGAATGIPAAFQAMRSGGRGTVPRHGRPVPTIVFQGDRDAIVHPDNADLLVAALLEGVAVGAAPRRETGHAGGRDYERQLHRDAAGRLLVERWTLLDAGHAWSGGDPAGSYADAQGPDASAAMVAFFQAAGTGA